MLAVHRQHRAGEETRGGDRPLCSLVSVSVLHSALCCHRPVPCPLVSRLSPFSASAVQQHSTSPPPTSHSTFGLLSTPSLFSTSHCTCDVWWPGRVLPLTAVCRYRNGSSSLIDTTAACYFVSSFASLNGLHILILSVGQLCCSASELIHSTVVVAVLASRRGTMVDREQCQTHGAGRRRLPAIREPVQPTKVSCCGESAIGGFPLRLPPPPTSLPKRMSGGRAWLRPIEKVVDSDERVGRCSVRQ